MKNFKRIMSMLLLLSMVLSMLPVVSLTASAAQSATISFAGGDSENHDTLTFEVSGVSAVFTKNTHTTSPRHDATCVRFYGTASVSNALTISAPSGQKITDIAFAMNGTYSLSAVSADSGTISGTNWTGSAETVVFTSTAQTRIEGVTVTYGTSSTGGGSGSGTTIGTLTSGNYVIAALVNGKYYAMSETIASGKFSSKEVTVTNGKVSTADAAGYTYTVTASGSDYTIASSGTGKYLVYNSSTNFKFADAAENWTLSAGEHGSYRVTNATSGRAIVYRAGATLKFGAYATSNINGTEYFDVEFLPIEGSSTPVDPDVPVIPDVPENNLVENGNYVIAAKVGDVYYAMSGTISGKITGKVINVVDGTVNAADAIGFVYTLNSTANGYTIKNDTQYLCYESKTGSNFKGKDSIDSSAYWTITAGTNGSYRIASVDASTKGLFYRASTDKATYDIFGFYATSNVSSASTTSYYDVELLPVDVAPGGTTETFVKVTSNASLGKGYYLIVCEEHSMLFDSSLEKLDVVNNNQTITIANNTIVTTLDFAFAVYPGGQNNDDMEQATIKSSKGYYIGRPSSTSANGITAETDVSHLNSISIGEDGYATILADNGHFFGFNPASNQMRFRYFGLTSTTEKYPKISLYKSTTAMPGEQRVNVSWSETGAAEGEEGGTVSLKDAYGNSISSGATIDTGSKLTLTVTPDEGYTVASVKINGKAYEIAETGGNVEFTATGNTIIEITWEEIVLVSKEIDLKIVSGYGKIQVYRNGELMGSHEGGAAKNGVPLDKPAYVGDILKLVIKPGEGYRLTAVENGGQRVLRENLTWDATEEAYTCEIEVKGSSNVLRFSFLPRKTDIGVIAELATSFTPGKYVITGTTFDPLEGNSFDTKETYLLFGCDDLLVDNQTDLIGDKAAALNLYDGGITIQKSTPYTMEGLTKGSLYDFQPYEDTGYYTIQICGMTESRYLGAGNSNELRADAAITDQSLWSVSITESGVATITNKATGRILKFNSNSGNDQFRVYNNNSTGYHLPVLYKATVTGYQVNYSKEGLGSVTAYNTTTSTSVASGSIQNENSTIVFNFTPAQYNNLEAVYLNGEDVTTQVVNGRLTISSLSENITVHAVFSEIVISNTVFINYFVNGVWRDEVELKELSVFSIVPDLSHTVVIDGKTYKYSDLTFEYSENLNTGAMYANPNDAIKIDDGHVINIYFLTSAIKLNKTAVQTTQTNNNDTGNGGDDSSSNFAEANNESDEANHSDDHGNIKQTYQITLEAQSSNWMETVTTGGNTDIIVILDNSLSMYDYTEDGTNSSIVNRDVLLKSLKQFLDIVFIDNAANNRVSLISYHTTAYLHNSNNAGGYRKTQTLPTSFTYDNTFMTNKDTIYNLANNLMGKSNSESNVDAALSNDGGTTNPEAALLLAKQVAQLRTGDNAKRDIIVIMFTDGKPTSRLTNDYNYTMDSTGDGTRWSGGNETSSREFNETLSAGLALKNYFNGKCKSTIYSVALLNALESSSNVNKYYTMVGYLYGAGSNARQWVGVQDNDIVPNVNTSSNWKKVTGFSDVYKPIYTNQVDVQTELSGLFESIAYTAVPGHYVTIHGSVVDVIPPQFTLTQESYDELIDAGWTITVGPNGTTLTHSNFPATHVDANNHDEVSKVTYEIECVGGGYGSFFTNTYATFTYNDVQTDKPVSANFYKPTVEIIPWTVDDHGVASPKTDLVIDILANDLFAEYVAGGYTIENCVITLTDKDGNPVTYLNAVEQNGDPSTYFDAVLNESNNTVTFYTETNGSYQFYYVVAATVVKPDGSKEVVYSRVTTVDVVTPNVNLNKTAQEVTSNAAYESFVDTDDYGNVQQLYLITLKVDKLGTEDKVYNGVLTDKIPADFEFVKFVNPASNANLSHKDGVITWKNISATGSASNVATLQFLVRYIGNGYGSAYTNTSANFSYNFGTSDGPQTTQYFPVPTAGLNPSTVNDVDIAHSGDTNTMNVLDNDLFTDGGFQLPNYPVGGVTVIITDENGNPLADPEAYYGMEITVNPDGTITYTAPEGEGPVQFYYVVEATVNLPLDSNYAEDNSTTLQSRPTMVTVYTITDKYLVVDFGYTTDGLSLLPDCDVIIDAAKGVSLQDCITFSTPAVNGAYGSASYETLTDDVTFSYSPKTMDFYAVDHFPTSLSTTKNTYVSVEREVASGVTVVPANNLFFEENFINFGVYTPGEGDGKTNENQGTWDPGAWVTEGTTDNGRTQGTANKTYGYDDAYKTGEVYSGGSTKAVTVVPNQGDEGNMYGDECGYFTFTGTGFDIYATCSRDTGVLIAEVYAYDEEKDYGMGDLQRVILIDTYMDGGEGVVFDQLPVIMCHDLDYDRYTVKLRAYYHPIFDHNYVKPEGRAVRKILGLDYDVPLEIQTLDAGNAKPSTRSMPAAANGQYNVYVDSVRIYNPITEVPTEVIANKAYSDANEINSHFTNIRDLILDAGNWTAGQSAVNGVLYIVDQRAGKLNGGESGAVEDDNTIPAPAVDGFYLSPTGEMKTVVENGKTYLLDTDGKKASYNGCDIYIVYIEDTAEGQNVYYVADNDVSISRIGYRYTENGTEKELSVKALEDLNIIHYTSQYEAFGPKYEVHLKNGGGIAFSILGQTYAQVSAKMADDGQAQIYAYYTKDNKLDWYPVDTVTSRTEMYYDLSDCIEEGMLIIKCVSDDPNAILSLCNLKTSGDVGGTDIEPLVDGRTIVRAAFAFADKGDALEEVETPVDEKITIGQKLYLESDLTMTFRVKESVLEGYDLSTLSLTVERDIYTTKGEMIVDTQIITDYEIVDGVLVFTYGGIAAAQMNDEIRVVLNIKDAYGNDYTGVKLVTSVANYAKCLLEIYGTGNAKLCTLVMDMLNYGAAAQAYFNRHADAPANEAYAIFADYASYASQDLISALEDLSLQKENQGTTATMGISLELATSIGISYAVKLPQNAIAEDASLVICDAEGNILETIALSEGAMDAQGRYVVKFYGLASRQMREVVYATVYMGGEAISNTYAYSISSYAAQVSNYEGATAELMDLTRLMVIYGDAAKAYFAG